MYLNMYMPYIIGLHGFAFFEKIAHLMSWFVAECAARQESNPEEWVHRTLGEPSRCSTVRALSFSSGNWTQGQSVRKHSRSPPAQMSYEVDCNHPCPGSSPGLKRPSYKSGQSRLCCVVMVHQECMHSLFRVRFLARSTLRNKSGH